MTDLFPFHPLSVAPKYGNIETGLLISYIGLSFRDSQQDIKVTSIANFTVILEYLLASSSRLLTTTKECRARTRTIDGDVALDAPRSCRLTGLIDGRHSTLPLLSEQLFPYSASGVCEQFPRRSTFLFFFFKSSSTGIVS